MAPQRRRHVSQSPVQHLARRVVRLPSGMPVVEQRARAPGPRLRKRCLHCSASLAIAGSGAELVFNAVCSARNSICRRWR